MVKVLPCDREAAADAYAELTGIRTGADQMHGDWLAKRFAAHREGAEKAEREEIATWLLSDDARLTYEEQPVRSREHAFWWAADAIRTRGEA